MKAILVVRKHMKNNYIIIGDDKKTIDFYKQDIITKWHLESPDIIDDESLLTLSNLLDEASTPSMFSQNKIIIANDFDFSKIIDSDLNYLKQYLNNPNKNAYLIIITDKLDARTAIYKQVKDAFEIIDTSKTTDSEDIFNFTKELIHSKGYKMNDNSINYFLNKVGSDIYNIQNELTKLFIYKEDNKEILIEDIDKLVADNIDSIIYEFTNAILDNDTENIVKMYRNFKTQGLTLDYFISSLSNVFRQALIIKILKNSGKSNLEISKVIGKKEYYVKKMLERIYPYSESDLAKYLEKLAKIDADFKMGESTIDKFALFIIDKEKSS